ncbi:hypothetical protein HDE_06702 [Halotydeus destructor]|nr:hypothetical protein HDE_06702 [Halotydeus destructor]
MDASITALVEEIFAECRNGNKETVPERRAPAKKPRVSANDDGVNKLESVLSKPLKRATKSRFNKLITLAIRKKFKVLLDTLESCDDGTLVWMACEIPNLLVVLSHRPGNKYLCQLTKLLLERASIDINWHDEKYGHFLFNLIKNTSTQAEAAFHYALGRSDLDVNVMFATRYGKSSSLQYALAKGAWDLAIKLVLRGADVTTVSLKSIYNSGFLACFQVIYYHGKIMDLSQLAIYDAMKHSKELGKWYKFVFMWTRESIVPSLQVMSLMALTGKMIIQLAARKCEENDDAAVDKTSLMSKG